MSRYTLTLRETILRKIRGFTFWGFVHVRLHSSGFWKMEKHDYPISFFLAFSGNSFVLHFYGIRRFVVLQPISSPANNLLKSVHCWKGLKGIPAKGMGTNTLKVKRKGKFRAYSGYFQGVFRYCQGFSGCFQGVFSVFFPIPFAGIPFGPFQHC